MNTLLLYDLFNEVRANKKLTSPGLDDYFRLLDLLEKGYPVHTFNELLFVCETLWIKSLDQQEVFHEVFKKFQSFIEASFAEKTPAQKPVKPGLSELEKSAAAGLQARPLETKDTSGTQKIKKESEITGARFSVGEKAPGSFGLNIETEAASVATIDIPYLFTNDYFPVSSRQLQQGWRNLKSSYAGASGDCINYPATIEKSARDGMIANLVYTKESLNKLKLFVLIDHEGSMAAFEAFGKELVKTALESEMHKNIKPHFFYNLPVYDKIKKDYVLLNEAHTKTKTIAQLFKGAIKQETVVLIFSDAGSLSGSYNARRVEYALKFLDNLQQRTAYVSWLNPVPAHRWRHTTAEPISQAIPMFECTRKDFEKVISSLKGNALARISK